MAARYEDTRAIALTVGDMLTLANALYDAVRYNEKGNFPQTAKDVERLQAEVRAQTEDWINEADAHIMAEITAHKKQA